MARALRIEYEGAIYHVLARGHRGERIFYTDRDKVVFLEKLVDVIEKYHLNVHCYILMDNHYHLLLSTPDANLSRSMHLLNTSYSNWFKSKYKLIGSIFQGRFKAILVETEEYMLVLSAYIHLNPVRSKQVEKPGDYIWSSFRSYLTNQGGGGADIGNAEESCTRGLPQRYIFTSEILELVSGNRESYRSYVHGLLNRDGNMDREEIYGVHSIIGSDEFRKGILSQVGFSSGQWEEREKPELYHLNKFTSDEIVKKIIYLFGVSKEEVYSKKKGNVYKKLYLLALRNHSDLSLKEIGSLLGMDYAAVSQMVRRFNKELEQDKRLKSMADRLKRNLRRF